MFRSTTSEWRGRAWRPQIEALEDRTVPASITLDGNVLNILDTSKPDKIAIDADASTITVRMTGGTRLMRTFDVSKVSNIVVRSLSGNDRVDNNTGLDCEVDVLRKAKGPGPKGIRGHGFHLGSQGAQPSKRTGAIGVHNVAADV